MAKTVSNEEIIAALMLHGTAKEAAAAVGISTRTLYDRMAESEFVEAYTHAKADIVRQALNTLNGKLAAAIETVAEIMNNQDVNAATRLQAAQTIINSTAKFAERLTDSEYAATTLTQRANSPFDLGIIHL